MVLEEDPDWARGYRRPWVFEMTNRRRFYARDPLYAPYGDSGLINDGGVLQLVDDTGWAMSSIGLSAGEIWSNGWTVAIVPGALPFSGAAPVYFTGLTASQLLRTGGANLPTHGLIRADQLWNNGGLISIADEDFTTTFTLDSSVLDGGDVLA